MIIAVGNQKGGVGKTTTAVTLGAWFAEQAFRVLIVDLDAQGHVAESLGVATGNGLYRMLVQDMTPERVSVEARPGLEIVTNDHTAEKVKTHAMQSDFRAYMLAMALARAGAAYDLIVLDMPPSTDVLHVSALVASDWLVIPAVMDHLALTGVMTIWNSAQALVRYPNVTPPRLLGVLPTMFERTTNETQVNAARLAGALGNNELILPPVARDVKVREASGFGRTVWEYAPKSAAAVGWPARNGVRNSAGGLGGYLHLCEIVRAVIEA